MSDIEESKIRFSIFTFSEWKYDLTGVFTSQPIAVVALSTAPVSRPRAPSAEALALYPLAPYPPAPQQLPLACKAASSREPGQLPGLALHLYHQVVCHHLDNLSLGLSSTSWRQRNVHCSFSDKMFWQLWRAVLRIRKFMVSRCKQYLCDILEVWQNSVYKKKTKT